MATTFTDRDNLIWDVTLTMGAAQRVDKSDFSILTSQKFSIMELDERLITMLNMDQRLLVALVWAIVSPQAKVNYGHLNLTPTLDGNKVVETVAEKEQSLFVEALTPSVMRNMKEAFWEAIVDFFQERGIVLKEYKDQQEAILRKTAEKMLETTPMMEKIWQRDLEAQVSEIVKNLESETGVKSTKSSASLGSILTK